MEVDVTIVKAFTKNKDEGNPAGVILDADILRDDQMQAIASILGFSESAFVTKSETADYKVQFFSPQEEVALCGHNTVAAFHRLMEIGRINPDDETVKRVTQETKAGVFAVDCHKDGLVNMKQPDAEFLSIESDIEKVAKLLSIHLDQVLDHPLELVSTGVPKLMIPVMSRDTLFSIKPDYPGIIQYCRDSGARGLYAFTRETIEKDSDFHARQFNPLAGINEDPITGIAAGELAAYVKKHGISDKIHYIIEQGTILNMPGRMYVNISDGITVGGYATTIEQRKITVD